MAAAAAAASNPRPGEPPVVINTNDDREQWLRFDPLLFMNRCNEAFNDGDFSYVHVALRANHEASSAFIQDRVRNGSIEITGKESFQLLQMFAKTNALLGAMVSRNANIEREARGLIDRVNNLESDASNQSDLIQQISDLGEAIKGSKQTKSGKPISEYKALQDVKGFN